MTTPQTIDLTELCAKVRSALPQLGCELVYLEHTETRDRTLGLVIETEERVTDHVYRMTVADMGGGNVNFFVHVYGQSRDLTTEGTQRFRRVCGDVDEVFAIVRRCWTAGDPS